MKDVTKNELNLSNILLLNEQNTQPIEELKIIKEINVLPLPKNVIISAIFLATVSFPFIIFMNLLIFFTIFVAISYLFCFIHELSLNIQNQ